jgi:hypothetical protein
MVFCIHGTRVRRETREKTVWLGSEKTEIFACFALKRNSKNLKRKEKYGAK